MIIGAPYLERVGILRTGTRFGIGRSLAARANPEITRQPVQPISRRHLQIVEPGYRVDLVQFPSHDGPEHARDAPSCLAIHAVPDVPGGVVRQRPGSQNSTIARLACYSAIGSFTRSPRQSHQAFEFPVVGNSVTDEPNPNGIFMR